MANPDEQLFLWINGLSGHLSILDQGVEWMASDYLVTISLGLTLLGLWFCGNTRIDRDKNQLNVFMALIVMGLSSLVVHVANMIYFRPRPFVNHDVNLLFYQPTDSSFPANSMAVTFSIAISIWVINKKVGTTLILLTSLYGLTRIYAGVHYPTDILAGASISIAITFLVFKAKKYLTPVLMWAIKMIRVFCVA
jgi:undecaprenyl-diphosphatase